MFLICYEKLTLRIFLNFLHEVTVACKFKIDLIKLFWEKYCFKILGSKLVFQNFRKINACKFSDYLHQITVAYKLKIELNDILGKSILL